LKYVGPFVSCVKVVGGSASLSLARALAKELRADLVGVAQERHPGGFPDGERYVRLLSGVAGDHAVLVQTTWPDSKIVELFLLADAIRDAGARRLTVVVPYFGYSRQDKRFLEGEAVSAKTMAKHIALDADQMLTMAIHNPDILHMFPIPARDVSGMPAIGRYLKASDVDLVLAPDGNAIRFAREAAKVAGKPYDHLEKVRIDSYTVKVTPKELDVRAKSVAIVDDVVSTGGTIATVAKELRAQGARRVTTVCVHGLFVGKAVENLKACDEVVSTDTIPSPYTKVSVAPEFAAAVRALSGA
jgi:ribose-phosphate pyrophosphokinase